MIVEDERITAEDLRDILTHLGYQVTGVAVSGAEAISLAGASKPDLALMDIRIKGDMDGIDTARSLRERFKVPVIYLTAHADRDTLDRARFAEPLGYIVKPFQENELRASIEMALHKRAVDIQAVRERDVLSAALDLAGDGVVTVDALGAVTMLNAAAETWTGWPRKEAVGRSAGQVFQLTGGSPAGTLVSRVIRTAEIVELEEGATLMDRDGKEQTVEADGLLATCLQHEIDHLNGVLFIDHISRLKREMVIKKFTKAAKSKAL